MKDIDLSLDTLGTKLFRASARSPCSPLHNVFFLHCAPHGACQASSALEEARVDTPGANAGG